MYSCLAVETFFRSPARGTPGAWRAHRPTMNDDPVLLELEETRRGLWAESDGTLAGYARMVDRMGREARERFLAGQGGKKGGATPAKPSRKRKAPARRKTAAQQGAAKA